MKALLALTLALAAAAHAGAPDKLAERAGPQPNEAEARLAVAREVAKHLRDPADADRVRFVSGPRLASGTNFADGREQAWLMCVVQGTARMSRGPLDLDTKPYLLRTKPDGLAVVSLGNWKDSDVSC